MAEDLPSATLERGRSFFLHCALGLGNILGSHRSFERVIRRGEILVEASPDALVDHRFVAGEGEGGTRCHVGGEVERRVAQLFLVLTNEQQVGRNSSTAFFTGLRKSDGIQTEASPGWGRSRRSGIERQTAWRQESPAFPA